MTPMEITPQVIRRRRKQPIALVSSIEIATVPVNTSHWPFRWSLPMNNRISDDPLHSRNLRDFLSWKKQTINQFTIDAHPQAGLQSVPKQ